MNAHPWLAGSGFIEIDLRKELEPKFDFSLVLPIGQLDLVISGCNLLLGVNRIQMYPTQQKKKKNLIHCEKP
jgi:hypothetical protein